MALNSADGTVAETQMVHSHVTVVGGAGHVGLPLSIAFANKGLKVLVLDINEAVLETVRSGTMPFIEHNGEEELKRALASGNLTCSSKVSDIPTTSAVILTIGTPVDEFLNPVHSVVKDCIDPILPHMADGQLLILRSTVFPGTSEWLHRYIEGIGRNIKVAFCLERVVQGRALREIHDLPQIVAGATQAAEDEAAALFALIAPEIVRCKPKEAEFAKLFSNTYRYIEFAAANQLYMIAHSAGVDYNNVYRAMTHNYPRAANLPRPGFAAGPCLFKDTMQLAAYAQNQFGLGHHAMLVNEGLVLFVVEEMRRRFDLSKMTCGLLGMAFKADVDDIRASLSYKMRKVLALHAGTVLATDPHVTVDKTLQPLEQVLDESDILILCVPHSAYRDLDTRGKPVFDVWNFLPASRS